MGEAPEAHDSGDTPAADEQPDAGVSLGTEFRAEVWYWRGPAPFFFVTVPDAQCADLHDVASDVTYGWGMIPVHVRIGDTEWATSLWPKDDRYIVPLKAKVRTAEGIDDGDTVAVRLALRG